MSMSAEASFPVGPKWILMNFPWTKERQAYRTALVVIRWQMVTMARTATYEARRVVVADGLGVSKRLHGRVGLDDLVLQGALEGGGEEEQQH